MLDDLKAWLDHEPFVPFRVVVTSGGGYAVTSPYQIAIGKTQFDYYFPHSDRKATVRLNQVVSIETLEEAQPA
jgi:hypothetical protein